MRWVWMLATVGCAAPLAGDFESTLTEEGGCGDMFVYAVDAADEILLTVEADGPVAAAAGEDAVVHYSLPDAGVAITVDVGSSISDAICDDVIENGGPDVQSTWTAVSGDVHLELTFPTDTAAGSDPTARVELTDVVVESEAGEQVTIEAFTWEDVLVGWLPG